MYAYFKVSCQRYQDLMINSLHTLRMAQKLDYHSTECIYSPTAYRGHARALVKDLEAIRPSSILDIIYSGEAMAGMVKTDVRRPVQGMPCLTDFAQIEVDMADMSPTGKCAKCGSMSSQELCQACSLLETLNSGLAKVELNTSSVQRRAVKLAA